MRGMKTDIQNQVEQVDRIGLSLQATQVKNQGLMVVVGRDGQGRDIAFDLATLPHLLIGGSTGSGDWRLNRIGQVRVHQIDIVAVDAHEDA